MFYYELSVEARLAEVQALSDALLEFGAWSVAIEDADAGTAVESPLFDEPDDPINVGERSIVWHRARIHALLAPQREPLLLLAVAAHQLGWTKLPPYQVHKIESQDWVRRIQAQFGPMSIGEKIWVVPSWHRIPKEKPEDAYLLRLDPGLAFGTGSHPTTRLSMVWLEKTVEPHHTVLDYGCGSGILAILAKKLGAAHVIGVDIDPQALESARSNSARNQTEIEYFLPDACPDRCFDIVVANILLNPLMRMANRLCTKIRANGWLVLSGILERQADEVIGAYARWLELSVWRAQEGWVCLTGQYRMD